MINPDMRIYDYYVYSDEDGYGQPQLSDEVQGQVKMAIYTTSQSVQGNINYQNASYVGITHNSNITDKYVIQYGDEKLKVLYVGKKKSVFGATPVFLGAM